LCANSLKRNLNFLGNLGYLKSLIIDIFARGPSFSGPDLLNNTSLFCSVENIAFCFQPSFDQIFAQICSPLIMVFFFRGALGVS